MHAYKLWYLLKHRALCVQVQLECYSPSSLNRSTPIVVLSKTYLCLCNFNEKCTYIICDTKGAYYEKHIIFYDVANAINLM
jgi:hypothetical protein